MKLLATSLLTALAACASLPDGALTGTGVIQSVEEVPSRVVPRSRSPGQRESPSRSTSHRWQKAQMLTIRMDDGRVQELIQDEVVLKAGDRVEVMASGRVLRR